MMMSVHQLKKKLPHPYFQTSTNELKEVKLGTRNNSCPIFLNENLTLGEEEEANHKIIVRLK